MGRGELVRRGTHRAGASVSEIPDKLYFRIGEVARLCEVPAYVLRFWESEFPQLKPNKGGTGQRLYRRRDVELALRVKTLLKDEGYTIPGARQMLKSELKVKEPQLTLIAGATGGAAPDAKSLRSLRHELESLASMLAKPIGKSAKAQKARSKSRSQNIAVESAVQSIRPSRSVPEPALPEITPMLAPTLVPEPALEPTLAPLLLAPLEPELSPVVPTSEPAEPAPLVLTSTPALPLAASTPEAIEPEQPAPERMEARPTLVPPARVPKAAPSAGLLFDLFDTEQNSEGDER